MIGKNISNYRKRNGLTLSALSEQTGISKSYLSSLERNLKRNPSISIIEKISTVLKVDLKTLLKKEIEPERKQELQ